MCRPGSAIAARPAALTAQHTTTTSLNHKGRARALGLAQVERPRREGQPLVQELLGRVENIAGRHMAGIGDSNQKVVDAGLLGIRVHRQSIDIGNHIIRSPMHLHRRNIPLRNLPRQVRPIHQAPVGLVGLGLDSEAESLILHGSAQGDGGVHSGGIPGVTTLPLGAIGHVGIVHRGERASGGPANRHPLAVDAQISSILPQVPHSGSGVLLCHRCRRRGEQHAEILDGN
mmetsp:Transcript_51341/g.116996  ORF Transcript_51341/g.116996 Transcript_51341/m.116996 type:complete len:230 (-) Transcript_51341:481-1170(-)